MIWIETEGEEMKMRLNPGLEKRERVKYKEIYINQNHLFSIITHNLGTLRPLKPWTKQQIKNSLPGCTDVKSEIQERINSSSVDHRINK